MKKESDANLHNIDNIAVVKDEIPMPGDDLKQTLQLRFSCKDLPKVGRAGSGKNDSFCVFWALSPKNQKVKILGQTECISDNLNPDFSNVIEVDYHFE